MYICIFVCIHIVTYGTATETTELKDTDDYEWRGLTEARAPATTHQHHAPAW